MWVSLSAWWLGEALRVPPAFFLPLWRMPCHRAPHPTPALQHQRGLATPTPSSGQVEGLRPAGANFAQVICLRSCWRPGRAPLGPFHYSLLTFTWEGARSQNHGYFSKSADNSLKITRKCPLALRAVLANGRRTPRWRSIRVWPWRLWACCGVWGRFILLTLCPLSSLSTKPFSFQCPWSHQQLCPPRGLTLLCVVPQPP